MRKILQSLYKIKLFKRIIPSLLKKFIKIFNSNRVQIEYDNINFILNLSNPIDREIYLKGSYEKKQLDLVLSLIDKYKMNYFIDVGAHMGFYSMIIAKKDLFVYAFEPIKGNYNQLLSNKDINNFKNIKIFNFALSDEKKNIKMWVPDKNKTGGYSVYDENDEEIRNYENEKINTEDGKSEKGDEFIKIKGQKIIVKIDVERHELKVLNGIKDLLTNNKIILQVEIFNNRKKRIFDYLKRNDFNFIDVIKNDHYFKNF